ncbi:hypothetical protein PRABACTJOHN_03865 [Parabacteroides johnsonii DSM 18315]|uniref:Uncharacterized protein n=1 Tax=Parabacteroides johnsonii DSM 18315 TaxID=537006 RepID=B7BFN5_9BACT|nr:hypothetical protein PRABACTJOHN_03865 [Parabacteroides johnsonii DSM 18315]
MKKEAVLHILHLFLIVLCFCRRLIYSMLLFLTMIVMIDE